MGPRCAWLSLGVKANVAQNGLDASWPEGDGGLFAALGAKDGRLLDGMAVGRAVALGLAAFAAFGVVDEFLEPEEFLLVGGEYKAAATLHTAQDAIDEVHSAPESGESLPRNCCVG